MKIVAILMALTGVVIGAGAALEFRYFGPETREFWVGAFATPAGIFFAGVGLLLWRSRCGQRRIVLIAGLVMASATIAATALDVMGPPSHASGYRWRACGSGLGMEIWYFGRITHCNGTLDSVLLN